MAVLRLLIIASPYLILNIVLVSVHLRASLDPLPQLLAQSPDVEWGPVSGWYGPGTWGAFVILALSSMLSMTRECIRILRTSSRIPEPHKIWWNTDVLVTIVFILISGVDFYRSWNAFTSSRSLSEQARTLPGLLAAYRATSFGTIIMFLLGTLSILQLSSASGLYYRRYADFLPMALLIWCAVTVLLLLLYPSTTPLFSETLPPASGSSSDPSVSDDLTISHVITQELSGFISPKALLQSIKDLFIFASTPGCPEESGACMRVKMRLLLASAGVALYLTSGSPSYGYRFLRPLLRILMFIVILFLFYALSWLVIIPSFIAFFLIEWISIWVTSFPFLICASLLPGSGYFPYSGISILELDQIGPLVTALAVNVVVQLGIWTINSFVLGRLKNSASSEAFEMKQTLVISNASSSQIVTASSEDTLKSSDMVVNLSEHVTT